MPSGSYYCFADRCGISFWGPHNHDAIWHLAVVAVSFASYPFLAPTFSGALLTGYNVLLDIVIFILSKIGIPPLFTYFKLLPFLWFILLTAVIIWFARRIKDSAIFVGSLLFFVFLGGSFGYFLTLYHGGNLWGSANILAIQAGQSLINLQFAFSLVVLFVVLGILRDRKFTMKEALVLGLCAFLNIGLKFYAGVITLFLIGLYLSEHLYTKRSLIETIKLSSIIGVIAAIAVLVFYNPFVSLQSGSVFTFAPFSIVHAIIEEKSLFYLENVVNARYFLQSQGGGMRLLAIELFSTFLYIFFNLGVRSFGLLYFIVRVIKRTVTRFEVYIFLTMVFATALAVLFIQKGQWWNTVQFFYYTIVLSNIFIALLIHELVKTKKILLYSLSVFIILLSLPTNIDILRDFTAPNPAYISQDELDALEVLQKKPPGTVFNSFERDLEKKYGFYDYKVTGYVSGFTGKQTYLGDIVQLQLIGIDYEKRLERVQKLDCSVFKESDYIYFVKYHKGNYIQTCTKDIAKSFKNIYENNTVRLFEKID